MTPEAQFVRFTNKLPDDNGEQVLWRCKGCGEVLVHWRYHAICPQRPSTEPEAQETQMPRLDSHRCSSECGPECLPCEAKALARELAALHASRDALRSALDERTRERDALAAKLRDIRALDAPVPEEG